MGLFFISVFVCLCVLSSHTINWKSYVGLISKPTGRDNTLNPATLACLSCFSLFFSPYLIYLFFWWKGFRLANAFGDLGKAVRGCFILFPAKTKLDWRRNRGSLDVTSALPGAMVLIWKHDGSLGLLLQAQYVSLRREALA